MKSFSLILLLISIRIFSFGQTDCSIMKTGTFKYMEAEDTTAYFVITPTSHTEFYANGKYYIKSKMKWLNDCEYKLTMTAITIPEFPFKPGEEMKVKITEVEGNLVHYTSEVNGRKWETYVTKLE